ncbi:MAG: hypothetical protein ACOYJB_08075 [Christensenellaceae bacterium]
MKKTLFAVVCILLCAVLFVACGGGGQKAEAAANAGNDDYMSYTADDWNAASDDTKLAAATALMMKITPGADQIGEDDMKVGAEAMIPSIDVYFQQDTEGTLGDLAAASEELLGQVMAAE